MTRLSWLGRREKKLVESIAPAFAGGGGGGGGNGKEGQSQGECARPRRRSLAEVQNMTPNAGGAAKQKSHRVSFWSRGPRGAKANTGADGGSAAVDAEAKGRSKSRKGRPKTKTKTKTKGQGTGARPDNRLDGAALDTLNKYVEILPSRSRSRSRSGSNTRLWTEQSWVTSVDTLNDLCAASDYEQGNAHDLVVQKSASDASDLDSSLAGFGEEASLLHTADADADAGGEEADAEDDPGYCVVKPFGGEEASGSSRGAVLTAARRRSTLPDHHVDTSLGDLLASLGDGGDGVDGGDGGGDGGARSRAITPVRSRAPASLPEDATATVPPGLSLADKLEWLRNLEASNC